MKAKTRLVWMKLHAYLACFFLPLTLLYIFSGMLYFFDIKGKVTEEQEFFITIEQPWPETEQDAQRLVLQHLVGERFVELPEDYYLWEGKHDWYGHEREVLLSPTEQPNVVEIHIMEHDWVMQMLIIHKGFAGLYFKVMSVLFGISLAFTVLSGVIITLQLPQLKSTALWSIACGAGFLFIGFII